MNKWGNYQLGKIITIKQTNIGSALTDFPLYVKCDNTIMGQLIDQTNFYDIRFTDTLNNVLPYERETASSTVGNFWVKTSLSSTSGHPTRIYCYYKNSVSQTDGSNKTGTWDSNYKGVWHLPNGTILTGGESTSNGNNSTTITGTVTSGQIDGGANFDGVYTDNQYIEVASPSNLNITGDLTIETWIYPTTFGFDGNDGYNRRIIIKKIDADNCYQLCMDDYLNTNHGWIFSNIRSDYENLIGYGTSSNTTNTWYHIVVTFNGTTSVMAIYQNGISETDNHNNSGFGSGSSNALRFGLRTDGHGAFSGKLDEVRISNIVRSADWIKFEYNNMNSADQELTWSTI